MRFTDSEFNSHVEWFSPGGEPMWEQQRTHDHRQRARHRGYYYVASLPQDAIREPGRWRVRLSIDGAHAGDFFVVLR